MKRVTRMAPQVLRVRHAPDAPQMRVLSLCTGIGGIDLAAVMTGHMEIIGQVEIDDFCNRVLAAHDDLWPHVKRLRDIKEVVGDEFGRVDLIVAGFPCQPTSQAGQRRGEADARWLWPDVDRIIRRAQPTWVLLENVPGLISLGLDTVLGDLASAGYEAWPVVFPAAAVGAPHERERVFIVGYLADTIGERCVRLTDPADRYDAIGPQARWQEGAGRAEQSGQYVADTNQHSRRRTQRAERGDMGGASRADARDEGHSQWLAAERCGTDGSVAYSTERGPRCRTASWPDGQPTQCGKGAIGVADSEGGSRRGAARGNRGLALAGGVPLADSRGGQTESQLGRVAHGSADRLDGHPGNYHGWSGWPARPGAAQHAYEPPRTIIGRQPHRAARLKALGNAVVPQQVYPVLAAVAETWRLEYEQSI